MDVERNLNTNVIVIHIRFIGFKIPITNTRMSNVLHFRVELNLNTLSNTKVNVPFSFLLNIVNIYISIFYILRAFSSL